MAQFQHTRLLRVVCVAELSDGHGVLIDSTAQRNTLGVPLAMTMATETEPAPRDSWAFLDPPGMSLHSCTLTVEGLGGWTWIADMDEFFQRARQATPVPGLPAGRPELPGGAR